VLVVTGEAGIGKSRLLAVVAQRAEQSGMRVLTGRAVQGGGTYRAVAAALVDALRDGQLAESEDLRPYWAALARPVPGLAATADAHGAALRRPDGYVACTPPVPWRSRRRRWPLRCPPRWAPVPPPPWLGLHEH